MKIKFLSVVILTASLAIACKQNVSSNNAENKQQIDKNKNSKLATNKTNSNKVVKQPRFNKPANNTTIKNQQNRNATNTKKVASKQVRGANQTAKKRQNNITSVVGTGKINSPAYYAGIKKHLQLTDNKLRGLEGINRQFDKKLKQVPKVNGKANLAVIKRINSQRANTLKQYLGDAMFKKKIAYDVKYSKK